MRVSVVGVDHTTCPISVREPLTLSSQAAGLALRTLLDSPSIDEALVLSTCARTEIYLAGTDGARALETATDLLLTLNSEAGPYVKVRTDTDAVRHAFRVTAGLESQVVGEYEITGQVKAAVHQARAERGLGPELDGVFRRAISCSRRLRTETDLGAIDVSVAKAARSLYLQHGAIEDAAVLVLGSGKIARMLAREFKGARRLVMASRSPQATVGEDVEGQGLPLAEAIDRIAEFDVVCCATRSSRPLLTEADLLEAGPVVIIDVSVPRNVSLGASALPGISFYDVDAVIPSADAGRLQHPELVESILEAEVRDFVGQQSIRQVAPIISALRAHVDHVREVELKRLRSQLEHMDPGQRGAVETLTQRLIDRMFHHLVIRLRLAALTDPELIKAADFFFAHGDDSLFPSNDTPDIDLEAAASRSESTP